MALKKTARKTDRPLVAAIGNFDGVHLGHQYLLRKTVELAEKLNADPGVILFTPHPRRYFKPDDPPFLITSEKMRDEFLQSYGIKTIIPLIFDRELVNRSAEDFVSAILVEQLGLKGVVVGEDFRFGEARRGDGVLLTQMGGGLDMHVTLVSTKGEQDFLLFDDNANDASKNTALDSDDANRVIEEKISSSTIREALMKGEMRSVAKMLGRLWAIEAIVQMGFQRGRTIGFPTANLLLNGVIAPLFGVYAVTMEIEGRVHKGVANYGRKPTLGDFQPLLEVHVFDFDADIYGKVAKVSFIELLREERKFDGLESLKQQIALDCDRARALLH